MISVKDYKVDSGPITFTWKVLQLSEFICFTESKIPTFNAPYLERKILELSKFK
jgi:hypothetical protein